MNLLITREREREKSTSQIIDEKQPTGVTQAYTFFQCNTA